MDIYKTTNLVNGKVYVGKEKGVNKDYFGSGVIIKKALQKYEAENFRKDILEKCPSKTVNEREKFWIKALNSLTPGGYNISLGGDGGDTMSNHPNKKEIYKKIDHNGIKEIFCIDCKNKIEVHKSSRKPVCASCIDKRNTHTCINCGKVSKSDLGKRERTRKYCSGKCQHEFQRKNNGKRHLTPEHKRNLSKAMSGKVRKKRGPLSDIVKKRISRSLKEVFKKKKQKIVESDLRADI